MTSFPYMPPIQNKLTPYRVYPAWRIETKTTLSI